MSYFVWLLWMAVDTYLSFGWFTLTMAMLFLIAFVPWIVKRPRPRVVPSRLIIPIGFPIVILLYGTLHAAGPEGRQQPGAWIATYIVFGLLLVQALTSLHFLVRTERGARFLVGVVLIYELLFALCAAAMALMSVAGDWL